MYIGEQIRQKRQEQHLSQKQLAEKAGISASYLCDIEKGRGDGSIKALSALAGALDIKLQEIFVLREEEF